MISLLLAALLALSGPAVPSSSSPPRPAASLAPDDVVIENSGSTNTPGYRIVVHADATVDVAQSGSTARKSVTKAGAADLLAAVRAAGPLDAMSSARCMRSVSFGSITKVTYAGRTSSDLSCGAGPAGQQIASAVNAVVGQLDLQRFRSIRRHSGDRDLCPIRQLRPGP